MAKGVKFNIKLTVDGKHKDNAPKLSHEERMKKAREALKRIG